MTETATNAPVKVATNVLGKLNVADAGDIKRALASIPEGDTKTTVVLGTVLGTVSGVSWRSNKFDPTEPSIGLLGKFETVPAHLDDARSVAPVLFLPKAMLAAVFAQLGAENTKPDKVPAPGRAVDVQLDNTYRVSFEVGVRRSDTAIGYEYRCTFMDNLAVDDPFAEERAAAALKYGRPDPTALLMAPKAPEGEEVAPQSEPSAAPSSPGGAAPGKGKGK